MNSLLIVILCIATIESQKRYKICDVFAPNGVFSGGVKLYRLENQNQTKLKMYRIGENAGEKSGEWEAELKTNAGNKSIKFNGEAIDCCKNSVNQFSIKYVDEKEGKTYRHCVTQNVIINN